eukprot:4085035-Ditylum_brightwellii.AAC.1
MGMDWNINYIGMEKVRIKYHLSALINKLLKIDDLIENKLTKIKSIINLAHGDRYATLYNINQYMKHPNLIDDEVETIIPCQQDSELSLHTSIVYTPSTNVKD